MPRPTRRYLALAAVLLVGAGVAFGARRGQRSEGVPDTAPSHATYIVHTDVAGWYRVTPHESVVLSRYDLRMARVETELPWQLGAYRAEDLGPDPEIERWYDAPDVVIRRLYRGRDDDLVWLTAIASRGPKSYRLFEHAPRICFESSGWRVASDEVHAVPLGAGEMYVQRGLYVGTEDRRLVYSWYQWDSPSRDAAEGVASWRLSTSVATFGVATPSDKSILEGDERLSGMLGALFAGSVDWHRF